MSKSALWVSEELQEEIREEEGDNDIERLRNWKGETSEESSGYTEEEIRDIAREEAEDKIYELKRSM